jgi:hypothetical protein
MLSAALKRRRAAMVRVTAQTSRDGHALITRLFSPSVVWAAFAAHAADDACGLPFVASGHRRSFVESSSAALSASRAYRRPEPAPPTDSAIEEISA